MRMFFPLLGCRNVEPDETALRVEDLCGEPSCPAHALVFGGVMNDDTVAVQASCLWSFHAHALLHDVVVQHQTVVLPLGKKVARDLHGVLDVVDLADVEAIET